MAVSAEADDQNMAVSAEADDQNMAADKQTQLIMHYEL